MQTHSINFTKPLKRANLLPSSGNKTAPATATAKAQSLPQVPTHGNSENSQKLTATPSAEVATSSLPQSDLKQLFSKIEQQIQRHSTAHQQTIEQFQELAIRLAMEIASTVVRYEVTHNTGRIRGLLETHQAEHGSQTSLVMHMNNNDLEQLRISLPDALASDSLLQLKPDDSITVGDCRLESSDQTWVANYARQLDQIQLQLMESLHDARLEPDNLNPINSER